MWYSTRGTSVPSGVLFCKSFKSVLHSSVPFHKYFEHPYLLANQLTSNLYILWPIKIQMSKVGARVATVQAVKSLDGEVLAARGTRLGGRGIFIPHHHSICCHSETTYVMPPKLCDFLFLPFYHNLRKF